MGRRKYTDLELTKAVRLSPSFRQVLHRLGLKEAGGNYATLRRKIIELGLDTSHMTGQGWGRGVPHSPHVQLEEYLSNLRPIQTYKLKQRLLQEKVFERKCSRCHLETWLGQPIPLELEHKNGNPTDNSLDNLTLLCPNCHALTATYRGKNKKSK